ncbi:MAG TPA: hypothetical protein VEP90_02110, partial [Methylomirabilota bacterium]|nr:hypothetical protein [Methylomirabilota bacterium]
VLQPGTNILQAVGTTRHVEFSRQIVGRSMPGTEDQINLMAKVLSHCKDIDLEFARDFMNYLYEVGLGLTYEQIRKLKEATEEGLEDDYVLNHQFAAYLIRDTLDLRLAQYYLERANDEFPGNPSIIHSFGNLCFRQYRELLPNNPEEAREYFNTAREYLARSRALQYGEEEHGYYTEIVMLKHRLEKEQDPKNVRATIEAERHALLFEALRVVPNARQNLLRGQFGHERPFHQLPSDEQQLLKNQILSGEASHMLLEYYGNSLLSRPKTWTWKALRTLIDTYWARASSDFPIAVIICLLAKQAFIKNAQTRFNLLQTYYENTIQFNKAVIDFVLLAEYTRLLMVDAFVLGRYNFLRNSVVDLLELYRQKKPRFLGDEYILKDEFYQFDENDAEQNLNHFENYPNNIWSNSRHSERFERIAYISGSRKDRYVRIELDEITHYFVRAPRQEIATFGNAQLNFAVKYTPDGFFATDFIT